MTRGGSCQVGLGVGMETEGEVVGSGGVTRVVGRKVGGDGCGSPGLGVGTGVPGVGTTGGENVPVSDGGEGMGILTCCGCVKGDPPGMTAV
jgi:hypothetical protein